MDDASKAAARLATRDPACPAVIDEVTFHTYGDLHERADRWASYYGSPALTKSRIHAFAPQETDYRKLMQRVVKQHE